MECQHCPVTYPPTYLLPALLLSSPQATVLNFDCCHSADAAILVFLHNEPEVASIWRILG